MHPPEMEGDKSPNKNQFSISKGKLHSPDALQNTETSAVTADDSEANKRQVLNPLNIVVSDNGYSVYPQRSLSHSDGNVGSANAAINMRQNAVMHAGNENMYIIGIINSGVLYGPLAPPKNNILQCPATANFTKCIPLKYDPNAKLPVKLPPLQSGQITKLHGPNSATITSAASSKPKVLPRKVLSSNQPKPETITSGSQHWCDASTSRASSTTFNKPLPSQQPPQPLASIDMSLWTGCRVIYNPATLQFVGMQDLPNHNPVLLNEGDDPFTRNRRIVHPKRRSPRKK